MNQQEIAITIYEELRQLILSTEESQLLPKIKNKARNIDVLDRDRFEQSLLKLVQDKKFGRFRNTIYETLSSLDTLWSENAPKKDLTNKFWSAYNEGKYEDANQIYSELTKQGLDFLGIIDIGEGQLLPLHFKEEWNILQFSDRELRILGSDLKILHNIDIPKDKKIIDVLPSLQYKTSKTSDIEEKTWVLLENNIDNSRSIVPLNKDLKKLDLQAEIKVPDNLKEANRLSRFQGHLLLVSQNIIFYFQKNKGWDRWIRTDDKITCFEESNNYWVGLADGHVRVLESVENPGLRKSFERFPNCIKSFSSTDRFMVIASSNRLIVTDLEGNPILKPITVESKIIAAEVIKNEVLAIFQANGRLVGGDLQQGNILWEITLSAPFDSILTVVDKIYCHQKIGKTAHLLFPEKRRLIKALEEKNIHLIEKPIERNPEEPIMYFSQFVGRDDILEKIKKSRKSHFFIAGAPKTGKTSLLQVIRDVLSTSSRCCYIDMVELIKKNDSLEDFKLNFIKKCLAQHAMPLEDLKYSNGFLRLREMVDKVRGVKDYCVFCLDNFSTPNKSDPQWDEKFKDLFRELFVHQNVQMIITFTEKNRKEITSLFSGISTSVPIPKNKDCILLPLFSEAEARNAIRRIGSLNQQQVEKIYQYTGGFPHLIRLFQNWSSDETSITSHVKKISTESWRTIFAYFRELSADSYIFIATLLNNGLISKVTKYGHLYQDFPLLHKLIPRSSLEYVLKEIVNYSDGFRVEYDDNSFSITIKETAQLFQEASKCIPWVRMLSALFQFTANPNSQNAEKIAHAYTSIIKIGLEADDSLKEITQQFGDEFYINKLTEEGRKALGMPLVTFIVIPLKPWVADRSFESLQTLYVSLQEFVRKSKTLVLKEKPSSKFYILLFSFLGMDFKEIKDDVKELERVSVIDTYITKDILLSPEPSHKSTEYIFSQLNISERSPYTTAGAVQDLFYGRHLEIALIRGLPENIGIFGTRTIGKTSLLLKLYRDLKEQQNWRVYALDCSLIENEGKFLQNLAEKMELNFNEISDIEKFRRYITREAEAEDVQYLFLFDEVDGLVAYDTDTERQEKIFKTFNRLCTEPLKTGGVAARFVIFGFQQIYENMKNPYSRLYNFMVFLPLQSLDNKSALALVTTPMKDIHIKWQNKEKDASYLVEQCSDHPLFLQAACHDLLTILDDKDKNKDLIEKKDVEQALSYEKIRQLCMRYYHSSARQNIRSRRLLRKFKQSDEENVESFLHDIHKITILTAIINYSERKEPFTLIEIQNELKKLKIDIPPDSLLKILNWLCLRGTFRMIGEPTLITPKRTEIKKKIEQKIDQANEENRDIFGKLEVGKPDVYDNQDKFSLKFKYEFAVKIFPRILVANLGGMENCEKELKQLVSKKDWKKWIRRYA
jgi:Cdc6-like AAA superfamily ATPase